MSDKQAEALIRADELEAIGAESSSARAMAAHTIRLLYKENEALRARLAQPEPETAGYLTNAFGNEWVFTTKKINQHSQPLYTAPPQREWQGLTPEDKRIAGIPLYTDQISMSDAFDVIEKILKEKNT